MALKAKEDVLVIGAQPGDAAHQAYEHDGMDHGDCGESLGVEPVATNPRRSNRDHEPDSAGEKDGNDLKRAEKIARFLMLGAGGEPGDLADDRGTQTQVKNTDQRLEGGEKPDQPVRLNAQKVKIDRHDDDAEPKTPDLGEDVDQEVDTDGSDPPDQ